MPAIDPELKLTQVILGTGLLLSFAYQLLYSRRETTGGPERHPSSHSLGRCETCTQVVESDGSMSPMCQCKERRSGSSDAKPKDRDDMTVAGGSPDIVLLSMPEQQPVQPGLGSLLHVRHSPFLRPLDVAMPPATEATRTSSMNDRSWFSSTPNPGSMAAGLPGNPFPLRFAESTFPMGLAISGSVNRATILSETKGDPEVEDFASSGSFIQDRLLGCSDVHLRSADSADSDPHDSFDVYFLSGSPSDVPSGPTSPSSSSLEQQLQESPIRTGEISPSVSCGSLSTAGGEHPLSQDEGETSSVSTRRRRRPGAYERNRLGCNDVASASDLGFSVETPAAVLNVHSSSKRRRLRRKAAQKRRTQDVLSQSLQHSQSGVFSTAEPGRLGLPAAHPFNLQNLRLDPVVAGPSNAHQSLPCPTQVLYAVDGRRINYSASQRPELLGQPSQRSTPQDPRQRDLEVRSLCGPAPSGRSRIFDTPSPAANQPASRSRCPTDEPPPYEWNPFYDLSNTQAQSSSFGNRSAASFSYGPSPDAFADPPVWPPPLRQRYY